MKVLGDNLSSRYRDSLTRVSGQVSILARASAAMRSRPCTACTLAPSSPKNTLGQAQCAATDLYEAA